MRILLKLCLLAALFSLSGCLVTKVVTIPLRVAGEVVGMVPVVGGVDQRHLAFGQHLVDRCPRRPPLCRRPRDP